MITKINLNTVASYKNQTTLETDKRVNLIYGLNGTGKSTISDYLLHRTDEKYKNCSIEGLEDNYEILVYNQTFIQETFYEAENLKGIFTLSKENKEAETKIANAQEEIAKLETEKTSKNQELKTEKDALDEKLEKAKDSIWKIRKDYTGGDRVFEYCLDNLKGSKDSLFNYIVGLEKPATKPTESIEKIRNDLQSISGDNAQKYSTSSEITFTSQTIEIESLFSKQIVGNENSTVSELIKRLGNSDWVNEGLEYLPEEVIKENVTCPFCQEKTISNKLVESIKNYFDASYEADINTLQSFLDMYSQSIKNIPNKSVLEANPKFELHKKDFEIKYNAFLKVVENNQKLIEGKIKTPSISVELKSSKKSLEEVNEVIQKINTLVAKHNENIDQKETVKANIKKTFWEIMRWDYEQTISSINDDKARSDSIIETLKTNINDIAKKSQIKTQSFLNNKKRL